MSRKAGCEARRCMQHASVHRSEYACTCVVRSVRRARGSSDCHGQGATPPWLLCCCYAGVRQATTLVMHIVFTYRKVTCACALGNMCATLPVAPLLLPRFLQLNASPPCVQGLGTQHAHVARAPLCNVMHTHGPENDRVHALCRCEAAPPGARAYAHLCLCCSMSWRCRSTRAHLRVRRAWPRARRCGE